jgi:lipopolysaccharide/colanic/teichoic acid biosynthesis glycosyltransferase
VSFLPPLRVGTARQAAQAHRVEPAKRALDLLLAGSALVLLWPLLLAIVVAIRLTSRGPAVFRQERLGQGGQPFVMLKFRTMYTDTDDAVHRAYVTQLLTEDEPAAGGSAGLFKLEADPRVTPIGHWLRRTSLDELPQLLNVVRGEMSLVGPRPALGWEAQMYTEVDYRRFDVLPGITGLWQVSGRSRLSMREALVLDVEYVRRRSLWLDLVILARTIPTVLRSEAS